MTGVVPVVEPGPPTTHETDNHSQQPLNDPDGNPIYLTEQERLMDELLSTGQATLRSPNLTASLEYDRTQQRVCRGCGCTDDHACPGGCWWVDLDLCSRCAGGRGPT